MSTEAGAGVRVRGRRTGAPCTWLGKEEEVERKSILVGNSYTEANISRKRRKMLARTGALETEKWQSYQVRESLEIFVGAQKKGWVCVGTQTDPHL